VSVGDAVATTTPTFGRGVSTTFLQCRQLLALLDAEADPRLVAEPFDAWCEDNMLPWVLDHIHMDGDLVRRWQGGDVDLSRRLPADLILSAVAVDPRIGEVSPGYLGMRRLPVRLAAAVQPRADPRRARRHHPVRPGRGPPRWRRIAGELDRKFLAEASHVGGGDDQRGSRCVLHGHADRLVQGDLLW
jgi:hypothetical protein